MGCHQLQVGQRSVVMDLPFYQTPEGKDLLPPRLSSEGARVDPSWLLRFLHDPSLSGEKTPAQAAAIDTRSSRDADAAQCHLHRRVAETSCSASDHKQADI